MTTKHIQRSYIPGGKWVYYKIYCGINTADSLLTNTLSPIANSLIKDNIIDQWFFIRYADPEQHLRVRFHLKDEQLIGKVMDAIKVSIDPYMKDLIVKDIQLATYHREMERYGENTIEDLEYYFYQDTLAIMQIIQESPTEEIRFQRVLIFLDQIINIFLPDIETKFAFLERLQSSFKSEFQINSFGKKALGKKYRSFKNNESIAPLEIDLSTFEATYHIINRLDQKNQLQIPLEDLLASIIHMHVNRVFQSRQRLYEMVLYDFLFQNTRSEFYRKKKQRN